MLPLFLVLGFLSPAQASEPEAASTLAFKGQFRLRAETSDRTDFASRRDFLYLRVRPGFELRNASPFSLYFEPQLARALGEPSAAGLSLSGAASDPTLTVHQAFARWKAAGDQVVATGGRQILAYGDELVVGASEWNNVGRSFDAVKVSASYGLGASDVFASKLLDETFDEALSDRSFFGLYNRWSLGPGFQETDVYVLYLRSEGTTQVPKSGVWTYGARVKSAYGRLDYRLETGYQHDDSREVDAYQWDGSLGATVLRGPRLRIGAGVFRASRNYNQLFPTAHKWLGNADVFGRRNIEGGALGASVYPWKRLKLQAEVLRFFRTSSEAPAFALDGATPLGTPAASSSRTLGTELDWTAVYGLGAAAKLTAGFSTLFPGAYLRSQFGAKKPLFYYAQLEIPF